jgi:hypothetical protein
MPPLTRAQNVPHHVRRAHRRLVTLPLIIILVGMVASGAMGVYLLRQNNLTMITLRREVVRADAAGEIAPTEQALQALQGFVSRHMNTSTSVDLSASYRREVTKVQKSTASRLGNINLYNKAETACRDEGLEGGTDLADCITQKLSGQSGGLMSLPSPALFRYSFAAPSFSLDLAGFTLLISSIFTYAGLHQLASYLVRRYLPLLDRTTE